jgi:hypothetical protein
MTRQRIMRTVATLAAAGLAAWALGAHASRAADDSPARAPATLPPTVIVAYAPATQPTPADPHGNARPDGAHPATRAPETYTVEDMLDVLHETNPQLEERIRAAMEKSPAVVKDLIHENMPKVKTLIDMKRHDPEMYQLAVKDLAKTRECMDLAKTMHDAGITGDPAKQAQLRDLLRQRFDLRQQMREMELQHTEEQLNNRRAEIAARKQNEDKDVENDLKHMLAPPPKPKPADKTQSGPMTADH